mmetsp:Transcript_42631/g.117617  ORF Transcript_42631/g.117617 Transcript_42631/m.117617 type:complete len:225 (+) Transcript_42631:211-885(+)
MHRRRHERPEVHVMPYDRIELRRRNNRLVRLVGLRLGDLCFTVLGVGAIQPCQQLRRHVASHAVGRREACGVTIERRGHTKKRRVHRHLRRGIAVEVPHRRSEQNLAPATVAKYLWPLDEHSAPPGCECDKVLHGHVLDTPEAHQSEAGSLLAQSQELGVGHGQQLGCGALASLDKAKLQAWGEDFLLLTAFRGDGNTRWQRRKIAGDACHHFKGWLEERHVRR